MPHTDSDTANTISDPQDAPMTLEAAQRVEQEKLTRRAALRKLGFGAGLAAFSLLGVDDFARMVGQRLNRIAGDNQVAQAVATEFQSAGIALADNPSGISCNDCTTDTCIPDDEFDCIECSAAEYSFCDWWNEFIKHFRRVPKKPKVCDGGTYWDACRANPNTAGNALNCCQDACDVSCKTNEDMTVCNQNCAKKAGSPG